MEFRPTPFCLWVYTQRPSEDLQGSKHGDAVQWCSSAVPKNCGVQFSRVHEDDGETGSGGKLSKYSDDSGHLRKIYRERKYLT